MICLTVSRKDRKKMHRSLCILLALVGSLALIVPTLRAQEDKSETKKMPAAKPGDMHTEMEAMNRAIRTLNKSINDPAKKDANLAAVADLELHTVACKGMIPKTA